MPVAEQLPDLAELNIVCRAAERLLVDARTGAAGDAWSRKFPDFFAVLANSFVLRARGANSSLRIEALRL